MRRLWLVQARAVVEERLCGPAKSGTHAHSGNRQQLQALGLAGVRHRVPRASCSALILASCSAMHVILYCACIVSSYNILASCSALHSSHSSPRTTCSLHEYVTLVIRKAIPATALSQVHASLLTASQQGQS